ncbi:MAG: helix-turn-helix domain-containing protein [Pirellulales bacterium]
MSKSRATSVRLLRLLGAAATPVYVLDSERRIAYGNEACSVWLGVPIETLLGAVCSFHTPAEDDPLAALAAGLCPPPAAWLGQCTRGTISRPSGDASVRRSATFVPLSRGEGRGRPALLVVAAAEDLPTPTATTGTRLENSAADLHEELRRLRRAQAARFRLDALLGASPAMDRLRRQAALAAAGRESVVVWGPAGADRAGVAKAIHYAGAQAARPLVPLDCGLLGAELLRTTLAALTAGASPADALGRGTLLLLDVDRAPPEIQAELAALLARPSLGYRLLSTASAPLEAAAAKGNLRGDLAALLGTLTIELPPLARRQEDVPVVAQAMLEAENARGDKQLGGFTAEALDLLAAWNWPGDLAELKAAVQAAHQQATGPEVGVADLPSILRPGHEGPARRRRVEPIDLEATLRRIERELVERALKLAKGNKAKAARLLGLNRPRLYRRMVQLGLAEPEPGKSPPAPPVE